MFVSHYHPKSVIHKLLHVLRECMLSHQWDKAVQVLTSVSKGPQDTSDPLWKVKASNCTNAEWGLHEKEPYSTAVRFLFMQPHSACFHMCKQWRFRPACAYKCPCIIYEPFKMTSIDSDQSAQLHMFFQRVTQRSKQELMQVDITLFPEKRQGHLLEQGIYQD